MSKLVLFGDSLVAYCHKSEILMLEDKLQGQYDVYNCAVGGWDTDDLVKKAPYISTLKPDVVVISVGTNDSSAWKLVELSRFVQNLTPILESFKSSRIIFFPPPPVREESHVSPKLRHNVEIKKYHDASTAVCQEKEEECLNSWEIFWPLLEKAENYHEEDGVHLNEHGYEVLFDAIARELAA